MELDPNLCLDVPEGFDDTPLGREGPQLVLPQDRCGARHTSGIETFRVDGGYTPWA